MIITKYVIVDKNGEVVSYFDTFLGSYSTTKNLDEMLTFNSMEVAEGIAKYNSCSEREISFRAVEIQIETSWVIIDKQ